MGITAEESFALALSRKIREVTEQCIKSGYKFPEDYDALESFVCATIEDFIANQKYIKLIK